VPTNEEVRLMAVRLNNRAYEHAKRLITEGKFVYDQRDAWSEHQPSASKENEFLERHGFFEYGKWYLGVKTSIERTPNGITSSRMAISKTRTAAVSSLQKAGPANTSILTLRTQPHICMA
jgi:hypothetical protein